MIVTRRNVFGMFSQGLLLGFLQKAGGIVLSLILVRILAKEDFGAFSIASTALIFFMTASVERFAEHSYFVGPDGNPRYDRHFGFALLLHGAISALALGGAAIAATLPNYAPIAPLLAFGAAAPILNAPRIIYTVSLSRDLAWKRIRLLGIASFFFSACVTLILAFAGYGAIALMCQVVLTPIPFLVDMAINRRDLLAASFDMRGYRESFRFGGLRSAGAAMFQGQKFVENMVVGGALGLETLGVFGRAFALAQLTTGWLSQQLASLSYPILAKFESGTPAYKRASGMLFRSCLWTALPPAVAVGLADEAAIALIYGERWLDATPYFRPMIITVLSLTVLSGLNVVALCSKGALFVFLNQVALLLLGLAGLGVALPVSLRAYSWFLAVAFFLLTSVIVALLVRAAALSLVDTARGLAPAAALSAVVVLFGLSPALPVIAALPNWLELLAVSGTCALTMLILVRLLDAPGLGEVLAFMPDPIRQTLRRLFMLENLPNVDAKPVSTP